MCCFVPSLNLAYVGGAFDRGNQILEKDGKNKQAKHTHKTNHQ